MSDISSSVFSDIASTGAASQYVMPIESDRHVRTWMQWPSRVEIYDDIHYLDLVRADIAHLARTIAQFEPVIVLVHPDQAEHAQRRCGPTVRVVAMPVDDLWARDSGPTFVHGACGMTAVLDLHFSGWGGKQPCEDDAHVAERVARWLDVPLVDAGFAGEGGGIESDGAGTVLTTESCLLNPNRNPGLSRAEMDRLLAHGLGAQRVVWLAGVAGIDITDDHIDGFARIVAPGVVVFEQPDPADDPVWAGMISGAMAQLRGSTDARGQPFECLTLRSARRVRSNKLDFMNAYCNYYVCNGAVIMPEFGDVRADADAAAVLRECYPGRDIVQINVDRLHENGGGIHCATQQQPESRLLP